MAEYPTRTELRNIENWPIGKASDWFDYIKSVWWNAEWGYRRRGKSIWLSTGGWSGNEEIIGAMRENLILWNVTWYTARRGGHYKFVLR